MIKGSKYITITLVGMLVVASAAAVYLLREHYAPPLASVTTATTSAVQTAPVGVVYYLWYGNATTGVGGLGSPGWNSTSCPGGGAVVDRPNLGYYVSDSNQTFQTQISEMQSAGISFAVVSWWGPFTHGEAGAINKATHDLFSYLKATNSTFKVAVMVDAFPGTCSPPLPDVPMSQVYDYIYSNFAAPYGRWYFDWQNRPLLVTFNPVEPLYNDTRFTSRTIGNYACRPVETCAGHSSNQKLDWIWWDAPANFSQGEGGTGVNMTNDIGNPVISTDGEVTLVPRIDSFPDYALGYQAGYLKFDSTLTLGLYQYEWSYIVSHRDEIRLVLIYSWNEYHERTAIELQSTTELSPAYLLDITSSFIFKVRSNFVFDNQERLTATQGPIEVAVKSPCHLRVRFNSII